MNKSKDARWLATSAVDPATRSRIRIALGVGESIERFELPVICARHLAESILEQLALAHGGLAMNSQSATEEGSPSVEVSAPLLGVKV